LGKKKKTMKEKQTQKERNLLVGTLREQEKYSPHSKKDGGLNFGLGGREGGRRGGRDLGYLKWGGRTRGRSRKTITEKKRGRNWCCFDNEKGEGRGGGGHK